LVQWLTRKTLNRGYIPAGAVSEESTVEPDDLDAAIPYGVPWSSLITMTATPEALENRLHQIGVWTYDDLLANIQPVIGALQATYMVDFSALKRAAEGFSKEK
jgi:hypothetical protein